MHQEIIQSHILFLYARQNDKVNFKICSCLQLKISFPPHGECTCSAHDRRALVAVMEILWATLWHIDLLQLTDSFITNNCN